MRRTLTLCALLTLGWWASGNAEERERFRDVTISTFTIDTANFVSTDVAGKVNDSILFTSKEFGIPNNVSEIIVRLVRTSADTVFSKDSIAFDLQAKYDNAYDSTWWRLGGSTKAAEHLANTSAGSFRLTVPIDSVKSFGDIGRIRLYVIAEEDSLRAHDQTGLVPFNAIYKALVRMRLR